MKQDNPQAWEEVLKLFGIDNIKSLSVNDGKLTFTADTIRDSGEKMSLELIVHKLSDSFNHPEAMRAKVAHALPKATNIVTKEKVAGSKWVSLKLRNY